ncbi:MAG: hypothetical protein GYA36_23320 [Veillonellaceae bacterium]|nr:hypothetical protein [Veillonellaceae bacterium]
MDKDLVVENNEVCLDIQDVVISPTGNLDGFRYVIIYNDSHPSKALIGFLDYGRVISLRNGDTLTISFN